MELIQKLKETKEYFMAQDLDWIVTGFMRAPFIKRSQSQGNISKSGETMSSMLDTFHFEVLNNRYEFGTEVRDLG